MKLTKKFRDLQRRIFGPKPPKDSNSNRSSIDTAPGAHDPGPGNDAGTTEPTASGVNATMKQNMGRVNLNPAPCEDDTPKIPGPSDSGVAPSVHDAGTADRVKDALVVAWTGMEMLLKKVEGCLDGTLAKAPVAAINALIDIKNAVGDNKGATEELLIQTTERLLVVGQVVNQDVANSGKSRMTTFADTLRNEIHKLKKMSEKGTFRRVLENEADKDAISASLKHIDEATKTFQLYLAWTTEIKVDDIHSEIKLTKLDPLLARKAIYDADLGDGATVTREACTAGTREEILNNIIAWANDISADSSPVFWLTGQAGSGKTTIAYTVTKHFDELKETEDTRRHTVLGGNFLCSGQFNETRRQIYIIPTLVYQLARKSRPYAHALREADKFDSVDKLAKQMEDLLVGPWQRSQSRCDVEPPPYLIVVDALDEIEDDGGSAFLQSLLKTINERRLRGLKVLVTSRPDPRVVKLCETFLSKAVCRLQDVPIERVGPDITQYLQSKLPDFTGKPELKTMEQLAGGLFISAATIVRYLTPRKDITEPEQRDLLNTLHEQQSSSPSDALLIDKLYQQIMRDAFSKLDVKLFNRRLRILHTFLCTIERTPASLAAALLSESHGTVLAVLNGLHAVLYLKDGQVLWYHTSFPDFIFSQTRSTFKLDGREISVSCSQAQHHAFLTKCCFECMKESLRFNIGNITSSFLLDAEDPELTQRIDTNIKPFLRYASRHWAQHLTQTDQENGEDLGDYITEFLDIRILFWIEAMNLLGSSGQCTRMLQHVREWVLKNMNRNKLATNIAEAANFATYFVANPPALSTPHLYISALASWSTGSTMSQQWREKFHGIPSFTHRKASDVPLISIQTHTHILSVAFSTDGTCIVSGSRDNSVQVWDASTGAELKVLEGHMGSVLSIAFSTDGTRIVSGSDDKSVRVWDVLTGAELKVLEGHMGSVLSVAFSTDGTRIVSGSSDKCVRVWDASTGAELKVLKGHMDCVRSVAFSTDGTHIVSGSQDKSVRVWDASTGAELKVLEGHTHIAAISTYGTHIAVSGSEDNSVQVWDASTGAELKVLEGHTFIVRSVAFSTDGTRIVSGSRDDSVRVWDTSTGAELKVLEGHTHSISSIAFSTDGTRIVSGSGDKSVRVWDVSTGAELKVLEGHTGSVWSVAFSTDGTRIVSGSSDRFCWVWDASTGAELKVLKGHMGAISSVAFSTDGTRIVSGSGDTSVRVWDASTGAELKVLEGHTGHMGAISSIAFSTDGTRIVSGSGDTSVRVWDASTGAELKVLEGHTEDYSVRLWDALTGAELKVLEGHTDYVWSVAFSTDGTCIVSGSADYSVRVWDASTGAELNVLKGHTHYVYSVAFSTDGTRIVSGSADNSVRVWDASTWAQMPNINICTNSLNSITSPADNTCITSDDESAQLSIVGYPYPAWTTDGKHWICSALGGYRLMWVPEMAYPYSILVISRKGSAIVNFQGSKIGHDWADCYTPT
ncbi:uncharacterized protein LACBIDRAFT_389232 [Laccaria bicolor S238N-H82]|uniref:Predicted protein n=1 Tax=Laccaria bicolor (strain S238N-H82 / ATCC MYA-4686) TaxID=486041 RepID=B0DFW7_LACBS|nr:uncharacterized protein LACBIDRAFT_389232 [Laccaria bicolor S238N-H82]EDR06536.1 predicted protein [Laccaria bicolor S238N-H82]|eukprot:XP_001882908.1 predicted protein [Laccaria bicolor S238N-H82]